MKKHYIVLDGCDAILAVHTSFDDAANWVVDRMRSMLTTIKYDQRARLLTIKPVVNEEA